MKYWIYAIVLMLLWLPVFVFKLDGWLIIVIFAFTIGCTVYMYGQRLLDDERDLE